MKPLVERWTIIVQERFKPSVYLPMIVLFTLVNALYLQQSERTEWSWWRFAATLLMLVLFFLRMRVFDEIKDYETDLVVNPHRPLARGVASFRQVKRGLFVFLCIELIIAWNLGFWPFLTHTLACFYSVLMFEEFFLGDHIRPHLTTYAVTHTFVSSLLGLSAAIAVTPMDLRSLTGFHLAFFLMNWAFFNLFEFARKTFAPEEERPKVESYTKIFGIWGAFLLSLSQGIVGNLLLSRALESPWFGPSAQKYLPLSWGALILYAVASLPFLVKTNRVHGRWFRLISSFYLLLHYMVVVAILMLR